MLPGRLFYMAFFIHDNMHLHYLRPDSDRPEAPPGQATLQSWSRPRRARPDRAANHTWSGSRRRLRPRESSPNGSTSPSGSEGQGSPLRPQPRVASGSSSPPRPPPTRTSPTTVRCRRPYRSGKVEVECACWALGRSDEVKARV